MIGMMPGGVKASTPHYVYVPTPMTYDAAKAHCHAMGNSSAQANLAHVRSGEEDVMAATAAVGCAADQLSRYECRDDWSQPGYDLAYMTLPSKAACAAWCCSFEEQCVLFEYDAAERRCLLSKYRWTQVRTRRQVGTTTCQLRPGLLNAKTPRSGADATVWIGLRSASNKWEDGVPGGGFARWLRPTFPLRRPKMDCTLLAATAKATETTWRDAACWSQHPSLCIIDDLKFTIAAVGKYDDVFAETYSLTTAAPDPAIDSYYWSATPGGSLSALDSQQQQQQQPGPTKKPSSGAHFYFYPGVAMGFSPISPIQLFPTASAPPPPGGGASAFGAASAFTTLLPPFMCHASCPQSYNGDVHALLLDPWRNVDTFPADGQLQPSETDCASGPLGGLFDEEAYTKRPGEDSVRWFRFAGEAGAHIAESYSPRVNMRTSWLPTAHPTAGSPPEQAEVCWDASCQGPKTAVTICACSYPETQYTTAYTYQLPRPAPCKSGQADDAKVSSAFSALPVVYTASSAPVGQAPSAPPGMGLSWTPPSAPVAEIEGSVRLADGANGWSGRVEIFHDGKWGSLCDATAASSASSTSPSAVSALSELSEGEYLNIANVVCRKLGFGGPDPDGECSAGPQICCPYAGEGCTNTCARSDNGMCEDGGRSSIRRACTLGSDCDDCGSRIVEGCSKARCECWKAAPGHPTVRHVARRNSGATGPVWAQTFRVDATGRAKLSCTGRETDLRECANFGWLDDGPSSLGTCTHATDLHVECDGAPAPPPSPPSPPPLPMAPPPPPPSWYLAVRTTASAGRNSAPFGTGVESLSFKDSFNLTAEPEGVYEAFRSASGVRQVALVRTDRNGFRTRSVYSLPRPLDKSLRDTILDCGSESEDSYARTPSVDQWTTAHSALRELDMKIQKQGAKCTESSLSGAATNSFLGDFATLAECAAACDAVKSTPFAAKNEGCRFFAYGGEVHAGHCDHLHVDSLSQCTEWKQDSTVSIYSIADPLPMEWSPELPETQLHPAGGRMMPGGMMPVNPYTQPSLFVNGLAGLEDAKRLCAAQPDCQGLTWEPSRNRWGGRKSANPVASPAGAGETSFIKRDPNFKTATSPIGFPPTRRPNHAEYTYPYLSLCRVDGSTSQETFKSTLAFTNGPYVAWGLFRQQRQQQYFPGFSALHSGATNSAQSYEIYLNADSCPAGDCGPSFDLASGLVLSSSDGVGDASMPLSLLSAPPAPPIMTASGDPGYYVALRTLRMAHLEFGTLDALKFSPSPNGEGPGVFEAFRSVLGASKLRLVRTDDMRWASYELHAPLKASLHSTLLRCGETDTFSGAPSTTAWTSAYSGVKSGGDLQANTPNPFLSGGLPFVFLCGVSASSEERDHSVLAFSDARGDGNSWGNQWHGYMQQGTAWSMYNDKGLAGRGWKSNMAMPGYRGTNDGTYELHVYGRCRDGVDCGQAAGELPTSPHPPPSSPPPPSVPPPAIPSPFAPSPGMPPPPPSPPGQPMCHGSCPQGLGQSTALTGVWRRMMNTRLPVTGSTDELAPFPDGTAPQASEGSIQGAAAAGTARWYRFEDANAHFPTDEWQKWPFGTSIFSGVQRYFCGGPGHTYVSAAHPPIGGPPTAAKVCRASSRAFRIPTDTNGDTDWAALKASPTYGPRCDDLPPIDMCSCSYDGGLTTTYLYKMQASFANSPSTYHGNHFCSTQEPLPTAKPPTSLPPPPPVLASQVRLVPHASKAAAATAATAATTAVTSGRLEISRDRVWGTVSDDSFDMQAAIVVCRQLGYRTALGFRCCSYEGPGTGPVLLSQIRCTGTELSIGECASGSIADPSDHTEDVSVTCDPTPANAEGLSLPAAATTTPPPPAPAPPPAIPPEPPAPPKNIDLPSAMCHARCPQSLDQSVPIRDKARSVLNEENQNTNGYGRNPSVGNGDMELLRAHSGCSDECIGANDGMRRPFKGSDGVCEDGGPGSRSAFCLPGTDATDCGCGGQRVGQRTKWFRFEGEAGQHMVQRDPRGYPGFPTSPWSSSHMRCGYSRMAFLCSEHPNLGEGASAGERTSEP